VTGGADGRVLVWDLRRLTFLVELPHDDAEQSTRLGEEVRVTSVSINNRSGQILTLVGSRMRIFDINGNLIATHNSTSSSPFGNHNTPTCAIATDCPGYMEDGVVAVSGHKNGDVMLWGIHYDRKLLVHRHTVPDKVHTSPITALRISGERQDTLLVGDKTGKMSVCKTVRMDCLNQQELSVIMREIRNGGVPSDDFHITGMNSGGGGAGDGGPPQGTNAGFMDMMMTGND
jgi:WD40 repeat protein